MAKKNPGKNSEVVSFIGVSFFTWLFLCFFSSSIRSFWLAGFVFDIDDFHFRVYGKREISFPRAFLRFR